MECIGVIDQFQKRASLQPEAEKQAPSEAGREKPKQQPSHDQEAQDMTTMTHPASMSIEQRDYARRRKRGYCTSLNLEHTMKNLIDTIADLANMVAGLAIENMRVLLSATALVSLLIAGHIEVRHVVAEQNAQQTMFEQFTKSAAQAPAPAATAAAQKWCPVDNWPSNCQ